MQGSTPVGESSSLVASMVTADPAVRTSSVLFQTGTRRLLLAEPLVLRPPIRLEALTRSRMLFSKTEFGWKVSPRFT
jgi:hypothetical protein